MGGLAQRILGAAAGALALAGLVAWSLGAAGLVAALATAQDLTGRARLDAIMRGGPTPIVIVTRIAFDPAAPSVPWDTALGTPIAAILVSNSDGSAWEGSLGFGPPYGNAGGCVGIQARNVILACPLPRLAQTLNATIVAHRDAPEPCAGCGSRLPR